MINYKKLVELNVPNLNDSNFIDNFKTLIKNIDENFNIIAGGHILRGQPGTTPKIYDFNIFNIEDELFTDLTSFGSKLLFEIFNVPFDEGINFQIVKNEIDRIYTPKDGVSVMDFFNIKINNNFVNNVIPCYSLFNYNNESVETGDVIIDKENNVIIERISMVSPYVYIDRRITNEVNDPKLTTTIIETTSGLQCSDYFPTMYKKDNKWYWKINNYNTDVEVRGEKGERGDKNYIYNSKICRNVQNINVLEIFDIDTNSFIDESVFISKHPNLKENVINISSNQNINSDIFGWYVIKEASPEGEQEEIIINDVSVVTRLKVEPIYRLDSSIIFQKGLESIDSIGNKFYINSKKNVGGDNNKLYVLGTGGNHTIGYDESTKGNLEIKNVENLNLYPTIIETLIESLNIRSTDINIRNSNDINITNVSDINITNDLDIKIINKKDINITNAKDINIDGQSKINITAPDVNVFNHAKYIGNIYFSIDSNPSNPDSPTPGVTVPDGVSPDTVVTDNQKYSWILRGTDGEVIDRGSLNATWESDGNKWCKFAMKLTQGKMNTYKKIFIPSRVWFTSGIQIDVSYHRQEVYVNFKNYNGEVIENKKNCIENINVYVFELNI